MPLKKKKINLFKKEVKNYAGYSYSFAFGQAFFSLSVAGNGSVIYGSYLDKGEDLPGAARNVAVFDTLAATLAALVILPAMGVGGVTPDTAGPGLMFVYLVNVLNNAIRC